MIMARKASKRAPKPYLVETIADAQTPDTLRIRDDRVKATSDRQG